MPDSAQNDPNARERKTGDHHRDPVERLEPEVANEPRWLRPVVDYTPLAAFFIAYLARDLIFATWALMAATALSLGLSLAVARRVPMMPLVTAGIVGVFGGLTVWLNDATFIKMKPTIVQLLFAAVLLGGLALGKAPLRAVFGTAMPAMDDLGWHKLTLRYGLFFIVMAALNEAVWRTQSTDTWVAFKVFGIIGITLAFSMAQMPMMLKHRIPEEDET